MTKEKFFIKDDIVYSNHNLEIDFPKLDLNILNYNFNQKIDFNDFLKTLNKVEKIKKINISKPIDNFDDIKEKIKNTSEKKEADFQNDYEFIEKTLSLDILKQLLEQNEFKEFDKIKTLCKKILFNLKEQERKEINFYEDKIQKEKENLEKLEDKRKEFEEVNLNPVLEKYNLLSKEEKKLNLKLEKLNSNEDDSEIIYLKDKKENLENKKEDINFKIEKYKSEINLIKSKIQRIQHEIKLGKTRYIRPFLFILTLGLIYWTKYSSNYHKRNLLLIEIDKKQENILKQEDKLIENKHSLNSCENQIKKIHHKTHKKEAIDEDLREKTKIDLRKTQKELEQISNKKEKENKKYELYLKEINYHEKEIKEKEKILDELKEDKEKKTLEIIEKIQKEYQEKINNIEKIKKKIENQKIKMDFEGIIEV